MSAGLEERLFVGVFPGGIVYADRGVSEHGDYARVAFLPYDTLVLRWDRLSPLHELVLAHAATLQARRGELFALSATAERDAEGRLRGCGQTVRLGGVEGPAAEAPSTALFRKPGHPYDWDVSLRRASGKRWRYRGPHGWRSRIAATPAAAWALLRADMAAGGWAVVA